MNYAAIFKGRTRALFTDVFSLVVLIIISAVSVYISKVGQADSFVRMPIAVVNYDSGIWGEELMNVLSYEEEYEFYFTDEEQARKAIAENKAHGLIIIKPGFSDKISAGEYNSLFAVTVMSDSYDLNAFTEVLINDTIKIMMESFAETGLEEFANANEDEIKAFRENAAEIWAGESLLDIDPVMVNGANDDAEEDTYSGIRWYAALSLFYLIIGGTWMCDYGSRGLLKRVSGKSGNIALMYVSQALPGLIITTLMLIPVLIAEKSAGNPFLILIAYVLYIFGASGMALVICSLSGKFSNLVLVAPVMTMAASLISGLLFKLPNWAEFWEVISIVLPGHWFHLAVQGNHFFVGAIITGVIWFFLGMFTAWLLGLIRKK